MIEIRQKRQALHKQIRKDQIQKYFQDIRSKFYQQRNQNLSDLSLELSNKAKIQKIISLTMDQNQIRNKIRNNNFIYELQTFISKIYQTENYQDKKLLLILIANTLRNNLSIHQKIDIFSSSIKLIESLHILEFNQQNKKQKQIFTNILQKIDPAVIMYYLAQIFSLYQWVDEQHQVWIENNIYPIFFKVLLFVINDFSEWDYYKQFIEDCQICFHTLFNANQENYQTNNKMKAQRNIELFRYLQEKHLQIIGQKGQFPQIFPQIQAKFYWLYDYLSVYTKDLMPSICTSYSTFQLICKQFYMKTQRDKTLQIKIHNYCYSLLRTMLDQNIYIKQINQLMLKQPQNKFMSNFQVILIEAETIKQTEFEILQLIQGIVNHFCQAKQFSSIINAFWKKIIDLCLKNIEQSKNDQYYFSKHKLTLIKSLSILYDLISFGNLPQNLSKRKNSYLLYFQCLRGMNQLEEIQQFLDNNMDDDDSSVQKIKQYVDSLLVSVIEVDV